MELVKDSRGLGITIAGYVEKAAGLLELLLDHREHVHIIRYETNSEGG